MFKDARLKVKTAQTRLKKVLHQLLENFITATLRKLKNAWLQENTLAGIQFYGDMDD